MDRTPSGSHLALCDGTHSEQNDASAQAQDDYADTGAMPYRYRTPAEIESFFHGLDLIEPGVVSVPQWRPDQSDGAPSIHSGPPARIEEFGGVAAKR